MEALVLLTLHFSFVNIRYAVQKPESSAPIVWMLVTVNAVLLFGIVLSTILLLGRGRTVQVPFVADEKVADEQLAPDYRTDSPFSVLVRNGPEEQYGTFDISQT